MYTMEVGLSGINTQTVREKKKELPSDAPEKKPQEYFIVKDK